jgi:hypothetical protein
MGDDHLSNNYKIATGLVATPDPAPVWRNTHFDNSSAGKIWANQQTEQRPGNGGEPRATKSS